MRVRLFHWNEEDARERVERLRDLGFEVEFSPISPGLLKRIRAKPPDAAVIDLSRLPMQGRDVGLALRESKSTRSVALVFLNGESVKVAKVKRSLPDATYATWRNAKGAIERAAKNRLANPVVPSSRLAGYSGTPLPRKLGIKQGMKVGLIGAPPDFENLLTPMEDGVVVTRSPKTACDLALWFVRSRKELDSRLGRTKRVMGRGLWICWPKKASGVQSDVGEPDVRAAGLGNGLVDYKIAAIDATWSGLKFAVRKK